MAYKDEYEVARLYTDPVFLDKLRAQFEGEPGRDYQLNFWLAPPLMAKRDEKGHLVKRRFGPSTMTLFRLLAGLKGLRGGALDIFGKTEERRTERALIGEYRALLDTLTQGLSAANHDTAIALANLPDDIRGFGHVKENNLNAVRGRWGQAAGAVQASGGGAASRLIARRSRGRCRQSLAPALFSSINVQVNLGDLRIATATASRR